ncbi:ABC transporter substrate-binding protein [Chitinasiproducens palmae]|uniref:ABC-type transport system, substrate-binding protein n=1 Tax=Chitinasiproducens palmae TaxID=1770053 RepID=A0A1H2PUD9_9BURK|nr:ABC transporter substrate-binding protein [Chitinasiproducens palmae]SDV50795.1 ABC-type transport system, substrate-binding protein [Chitinasiproducens palmae]
MSINSNRRRFVGGMAASAAALSAAAFRINLAQAQTVSGTLRVGMTVSAVPSSNGAPDQGGEGQRFMGVTLYDQLVEWDLSHADRPATLKPGLATSWQPDAANKKRWHFTLRENVKFHDGHVFDADDVVFTLDRAFKRDAAAFDPRAYSQVLPQVPNVAAWGKEGPNKVWIETSVPDGTLPYAMTWLNILHRGAWEAAGKDWNKYMSQAVGTGPWMLRTFKPQERAVMVRNPNYWDPARMPKSAQLVLMPIPDANTRVAALQSGQVDFIEAPAPDAVPALKAGGFQVVTNQYPHNWMWFLSQTPNSPWRDLRIRKAANLGIDRAGLKQLLGGLMLEGAGVVPPGHPWYGHPTFKLIHDREAARKLMAEAGYTPAKPLRTKVAISSSGSGQMQPVPMNEFIQQNLREVGFDIQLEVFEWQSLIEAWKAGAGTPASRGCMAMNISQGPFDPFRAFARILQTNMAAPNGVNWSRFSDPAMDKQFEAVQLSTDTKKQDAMLAAIHGEVVDRALFLFAAHDLNPRALSSRVKGFVQAQSWFQDLTPIRMS